MEYIEVLVPEGYDKWVQLYDPMQDRWIITVHIHLGQVQDGRVGGVIVYHDGRPALEDIKRYVIEWHNQQINKEILSGHRWREMLVWLSPENQQNYKASFDLAMQFGGQGGTLPLVYKFGSELKPVYHQFNDLEELKEFYLSTVVYVKDTLAKGWKRKDDIDWTPYEQALQAYTT